MFFLPGMTEQSSTPSAIAFGLSEEALEGWKRKEKQNNLKPCLVFKTKVKSGGG